jgi:LacI family transcriptional regulator
MGLPHGPPWNIVGVGNEITATRSGLLSGHFHVLLAHPLPLLCKDLVEAMADMLAHPGGVFRQVLVPMEIHVPQSV